MVLEVDILGMDRNFLIQLTNNLYRLTLLFPKKEPLRYKIREVADGILAKPNQKDLEIIDSFLEVALVQNWVSPSEILAIKKEYDNLRGEFSLFIKPENEEKAEDPVIEVKPVNEVSPQSILQKQIVSEKSDRQEKIMGFLKESGRVQVWQVKQVFPEVSKRTLRRDFEAMLKSGIIERIGERNNTFYQVKVSQS